jgi:hypothetical protein
VVTEAMCCDVKFCSIALCLCGQSLRVPALISRAQRLGAAHGCNCSALMCYSVREAQFWAVEHDVEDILVGAPPRSSPCVCC